MLEIILQNQKNKDPPTTEEQPAIKDPPTTEEQPAIVMEESIKPKKKRGTLSLSLTYILIHSSNLSFLVSIQDEALKKSKIVTTRGKEKNNS